MPKVVKTPRGEVTVVPEQELAQFLAAMGGDGPPENVCSDCKETLWHTTVYHPVFTSRETGNTLDPHDAKTAMVYLVSFCPGCEEYPAEIGLPIVELGSFYNRPH